VVDVQIKHHLKNSRLSDLGPVDQTNQERYFPGISSHDSIRLDNSSGQGSVVPSFAGGAAAHVAMNIAWRQL
jgi:hypothetical protein